MAHYEISPSTNSALRTFSRTHYFFQGTGCAGAWARGVDAEVAGPVPVMATGGMLVPAWSQARPGPKPQLRRRLAASSSPPSSRKGSGRWRGGVEPGRRTTMLLRGLMRIYDCNSRQRRYTASVVVNSRSHKTNDRLQNTQRTVFSGDICTRGRHARLGPLCCRVPESY